MNSKGNILLVVLLIVSVVGVAIGGYFWSKQKSITPLGMPEIDKTVGWKTYQSEMFAFTIKYPNSWFLDHDVLKSYDSDLAPQTEGTMTGEMKCDFSLLNPEFTQISDSKKIIYTDDIVIYEGSTTDLSGLGGPKFGDNVVFTFESKNNRSLGLLCFSYDGSREAEFFQILSTFKFLDRESDKNVSCQVNSDCQATCAWGCVNKGWWSNAQKNDCEAIPNYSCQCVSNICVRTEEKFECPPGGWLNCMEILSPKAQKECNNVDWFKKNCPDFKGVAQ